MTSVLAGAAEAPAESSRLLTWYAVAVSLAIAGISLIDTRSWWYQVWQVAVGWTAAAGIFIGVRRQRPEGLVAWYLFGAGVFLAASGVMVEAIQVRLTGGAAKTPQVADFFYLSVYPALLVGLTVLLYRQSARQAAETLVLSTAASAGITVIMGIFAWEYIVWRAGTDESVTLARRLVITSYPLADLLVLSLMLRLALGGGPRGLAVVLALASQCFLLVADLGWMVVTRKAVQPDSITEHLLSMSSLTGYGLLGAASLSPSLRTIVPVAERRGLSPIGWVTFAVSVFIGPLVLVMQGLIDSWYHLRGGLSG